MGGLVGFPGPPEAVALGVADGLEDVGAERLVAWGEAGAGAFRAGRLGGFRPGRPGPGRGVGATLLAALELLAAGLAGWLAAGLTGWLEAGSAGAAC